ncbi:MAG: Phenylalanyl-tRNA synthetase beta chain (EC [uncultured Thiotrichaceae bacterium]|uniref:Phenylalanine--tRNA ligase beta subunit n=1 Tax=uncultured Thiotrichaceae bacterium TaxID=298394 RepID=A0A6S6T9G4_9GAMM|nr:MAG: Phenylalanyl-tRNA synthetase beta chain (EC [uncultured Thiotrichaceae bacterium]
MKVSEQWLRELVNPEQDIASIGERLTFAGVELDGVESVASDFTNVVVGQITKVEPHPDADRLRVCQVDVGAEELIQIVTNVAGVTPEMLVPVAMIGAKLPEKDGSIFKIKKSKLRGELSQGMFCGAETLGIDDDSEGLLEIPANAKPGEDVRELLSLNDAVLEFDITPNRADCLSMAGIAREVGVLTKTDLMPVTQASVIAVANDVFPVTIDAVDGCPRYVGRIIKNVNAAVKAPRWMREKLRRAGIRSLSAIVDVTNYVLLEMGQPMHAFDLDKLSGGIQVRRAESGEKLELLDGQIIELRDDSMVIADENSAVALAGIMGGLPTSVTDATTNILLESAHFKPVQIAGKARSYGLHTDSSYRFERGVSPEIQVRAIERATELIVEICGGEPSVIVDEVADKTVLEQRVIKLRRERVSRVLGLEIDDAEIENILTRLGCVLSKEDDGWQVTAPLFRFDMQIEVDLIEELARIYGYDQIPATLRKLSPMKVVDSEAEIQLDAFHKLLTSRDYQEVISYSFVDAEIESLLTPEMQAVALANPLSAELAVMRTTLWSGLLKVASHNLKRQQSRLRLFETGLTFVQTDEGLVQRKKLSGLITGSLQHAQWASSAQNVDFYDIKGDVEALLGVASGQDFVFEVGTVDCLHPGQSANIINTGGEVIGHVGALHPGIEKQLSLGQNVFIFELDVERIKHCEIPVYKKVSAYPAIQRDLALLVSDDVQFSQLEEVLKKSEIVQLIDYHLFDSYVGQGVPKGHKSLAMNLTFQDVERTLEEAEINSLIEKLVNLLAKQTGASLRI